MTHLVNQLIENPKEVETKIGYTFKDKQLLALAFVHRSFVNEHRTIEAHNERLEYLGDSVLGLLIADYLYHTFPTMPEGELSFLRSRLVEASSCVAFVKNLELEQYLFLGKGEQMSGGKGRESILADLFEAILAVIYLDGGINEAHRFLFSKCNTLIQSIIKMPVKNWKAILQDWCQKKHQQAPTYVVLEEVGPDHNKQFKIAVTINDNEIGQGSGSSKKEAQQNAAKTALEKLDL